MEDIAERYISEHDNSGNWSPFDRLERIAIRMFAKWLEEHFTITPK